MSSEIGILCPCCLDEDSFDAIAEFQCNHILCLPCLEKFLNADMFPKKCPMCRKKVVRFVIKGLVEHFDYFTMKIKSSVIEKLNLKIEQELFSG